MQHGYVGVVLSTGPTRLSTHFLHKNVIGGHKLTVFRRCQDTAALVGSTLRLNELTLDLLSVKAQLDSYDLL